MSKFSVVFSNHQSDQSELGLARSGLQSIERMVGDKAAWADSIKEEYNKLFTGQFVGEQPPDYSSNDNFIGIGSNFSPNKATQVIR